MISFLKRKKVFIAFIALTVLASALGGCGKKEGTEGEDKEVDVALITDYGTVDDNSYNQAAWNGMKKYAEEAGLKYDYYQPEGTDTESIMESIKRAEGDGAKLLVCPGNMLEVPVYNAMKKYKKCGFILVDGEPKNEEGTETEIGDNVSVITFAEEQAGFLAGYSAVRDGYRGLGFIGGMPIEPVIRFGYGFVQGADYAAIEMGVGVHIRYTYTETFSEDESIEELAGTWYDDDTEVIFACGGSLGKSVMRAAETHDGKVIGVDVDESSESETVITSAMKNIESAVYDDVKAFFEDRFAGGVATNMTAATNGVCLPMETSRFERFDDVSYKMVLGHLADGMLVPYKGTDIGTCEELTLVNTEVTFIAFTL